MRLAASHMTVSQASSAVEHDAVATVLIIGASRGIGLEAVKAALEAGHSVRALARSARRIRVDHSQLEKMAGDALEMATVKRALTGIDVVIQSLGVSVGPEIIFKPTRFFSKATRVLVTAMEEAQVKRLICVTGFGAGDSRGHGGLAFSRLRDFDDRHLYVSRDRSRNDQSDHFIEHPRRCGFSREGPTETTKFGLCCNSATAKDFPSSGAIMGSAKRIFRIKISVHFIRNAGESHAQAVPYSRRRSGAAGTFDGGECR